MWPFIGGRHYWGRREKGSLGIVVVFAWMSSQDKHLKRYINLYSSLGWNSLVCHPQFLNSFFPEQAASLAFNVLDKLVEELKISPCPVVFASFSGGPKACMYIVLQIIEGMCKKQDNMDTYQIVRDCVAGYIYDSCPVDFTSDMGTRFVLHPSVLPLSNPPRLVGWMANGVASGLDGIFLTRFESQRAEYWQTLYASVSMGAPYLIMCSDDDDLAPYQTICSFAQRLQELGADVRLVKWTSSPHVGHFRRHPNEYKAVVTEFLLKALSVYSQQRGNIGGEKMGPEGGRHVISEPLVDLRKAAASSNNAPVRYSTGLSEYSVMPSSFEYHEGRSVQNEPKTKLIYLPTPPMTPRIKANGVLGQIFFDVCVPQNIEEWDLTPPNKFRNSARRHPKHFNPIKCIRRSRL